MKKILVSILVFGLVLGCTPKEPENKSKTVDELRLALADFDSEDFLSETSVAYQIFPISFATSDTDRLGDIQGIINKLDYLNDGDPNTNTDLGIEAIWLNPIYPSQTYHKYDILDYKAIDPKFGTIEDFKQLIEESHKRGIKIILDMVFNHTAYDHPWFKAALKGEEPYVNYYRIEETLDLQEYPTRNAWKNASGKFYYAWFWEKMPELNLENEAVREEIRDISKFWMDLGVDGFRFDAAKHAYYPDEYPVGTPTLEKNLQFWMELRLFIKEQNPDFFLVSEIWDTAQNQAPYAHAYDTMFNFDFGEMVISALNVGNHGNLIQKHIDNVERLTDRNPNYVDSPFLTNHDQNRVMSLFAGSVDKAKIAAGLLLTMPGLPFIYYGEELGMLGVKPDERIREPMRWNDDIASEVAYWNQWIYNWETPNVMVQQADENSLWTLYRDLIQLRNTYADTFVWGDLEQVTMKNSSVLGYYRTDEENRFLIVANFYNGPMVGEFDTEILAKVEPLFTLGDVSIDSDKINLSSRAMVIYRVNP